MGVKVEIEIPDEIISYFRERNPSSSTEEIAKSIVEYALINLESIDQD